MVSVIDLSVDTDFLFHFFFVLALLGKPSPCEFICLVKNVTLLNQVDYSADK